jgi:hypothetical protein
MQNLRFSVIVVVPLLLHVHNVISMESNEGKINSLECVQKFNDPLIRVLSLKQLCSNVIAESIQKDDINILTSPIKMEIFSYLPEGLDKKITKNLFCYKSGYNYVYEKNIPKIDYELMFDETHNCVTFSNKKDATVTLLTMSGEKIIASSLSNVSDYYNDSLTEKQDREKDFLHFKKGDSSRSYSIVWKVLNNQQELVSWEDKKCNIYKDAHTLQFDKSKKICMAKNGDTVTIEKYKNGDESKIVLQDIEKALLNPNGKQLLIKRKDQPVELIMIKDQKTVFSFKEFSDQNIMLRGWGTNFSNDGNYLSVVQRIKTENTIKCVFHILNTKSGKICMVTTDYPSSFCQYVNEKFFILERSGEKCLMPIKNLCSLNDYLKKTSPIYTIEDIVASGMSKKFNDLKSFHPKDKHIVLKSEDQLKLVDPKSEKSVFIVDNVINYHFSRPTGKMLYLDQSDGFEVLSLRNDFTIAEYLLNRFMVEKNITESDLSNYPHMQEIYNKMDKDKRLFHCLDNGRIK